MDYFLISASNSKDICLRMGHLIQLAIFFNLFLQVTTVFSVSGTRCGSCSIRQPFNFSNYKDLSKILEASFVDVLFFPYNKKVKYSQIPKKLLLDNLDLKIEDYNASSKILKVEKKNKGIIERYSNLLRSKCPITGQPDWATVYIKYRSRYVIEDSLLLKYIISYREHADYHESCCEKIFNDLYLILSPKILVVKCFYTRRGGIDINPIRYFGEEPDLNFDFHYWRQ